MYGTEKAVFGCKNRHDANKWAKNAILYETKAEDKRLILKRQ